MSRRWLGQYDRGSTRRRWGGGSAAPSTAVTFLTLPGPSNNWISTPDSAANSLPATWDFRIRVSGVNLATASFAFAGKYDGGNGQTSWRILNLAGVIRLDNSANGSNIISSSTIAHGLANGEDAWIRLEFLGDGSSRISKAPGGRNPTDWTVLGNISGHYSSVYNGTRPVFLGAETSNSGVPMAGNIIQSLAYRDLTETALAWDFDPTTQVTVAGTRDPSTVTGGNGEIWTITGTAWDWGVAA